MVIVAGHLLVDAADRDRYLESCRSVVEQARTAAGCLDFAVSPHLVDERRINVFERWETQAAVDDFRGDGVDDEQGDLIRGASVAEYDIADVRELT